MSRSTRIRLVLAAVLVAIAPNLAGFSIDGLGLGLFRGQAALCVVVEQLPRDHAVSLVTFSAQADALRNAGKWRQFDVADLPADLPAIAAAKPTPPALLLLSEAGQVVYSGRLPASGADLEAVWRRYGGKP